MGIIILNSEGKRLVRPINLTLQVEYRVELDEAKTSTGGLFVMKPLV